MLKFLRIDYVYPDSSLGPITRLRHLLPRLPGHGLEVHQACLMLPHARLPPDLLGVPGVTLYPVPLSLEASSQDSLGLRTAAKINSDPENFGRIIMQLVAIAEAVEPDAIEVVDNAYQLGAELARRTLVPTALFFCMYHFIGKVLAHDSGALVSRGWLSGLRDSLPSFHGFWAVSDFFGYVARRELGIDPTAQVWRRPNGVDDSQIETLSSREDRRSQKVMLSLSRLDPEKGIHNIVTALPLIKRLLAKPVRLVIAGNANLYPNYRSILEYIADQHGVGDLLNFIGDVPHENVASLYRSADLYILASICPESGANTILEALGSGTPVLAAKATAAEEYISSAVGATFEPCDTGSLARTAARLLERTWDRRRIVDFVMTRYSWNASAARTLELVQRLLDSSIPPESTSA